MNGINEHLGNKPMATLSIHRHEKSRFPSYYLWPPHVKVKVRFFWPKNQVIWTTRCKVMAKYDIFRYISEKAGWPQGTSKTKIVS